MKKKLTRNSILGQQGINLIERIALDMKCAFHPTNANLEVGHDGHLELIDYGTNEAHSRIVFVQSKACGKFTKETTRTFTARFKRRDVEYWLNSNVPEIVIVSCPQRGEAYWKDVKSYFPTLTPGKVYYTAHFDKERDRFDTSCSTLLLKIAEPAMSVSPSIDYLSILSETNRSNPHYAVEMHTDGEATTYTVRTKSDDAEREQPLQFEGSIQFPDTPEGRILHEKFRRFDEDDEPLCLTPDMFNGFDIPEPIRPFFDKAGLQMEGRIWLIPLQVNVAINMEIITSGGWRERIMGISLRRTHNSYDLLAFSNYHTAQPFRLNLEYRRSKKTRQMSFELTYKNAAVGPAYDAYRFRETFAEGGRLLIESQDSKYIFFEENIAPKPSNKSPEWILLLLENLRVIQWKFHCSITLPDREPTDMEISDVQTITDIIDTGRLIVRNNIWSLEYDRKAIEEFFQNGNLEEEFPYDHKVSEYKRSVFGTTIDLGPTRHECPRVRLSPRYLNEARNLLQNGNAERIRLVFEPVEDEPVIITFDNWFKEP